MALTTFLVILALSLGITSILLVVAAWVSSPNRGSSSAAVPTNATVLQAWLAITLRPSRRNIAAWARAADRSWVVTSLIVGEALAMAINAASFIRTTIWPRPLPKGVRYLFGAPTPLGRLYYALDLAPIGVFITLVVIAYAVSRIMPPSDETPVARFQRVLTPYALASIPGAVAGVILAVLFLIPQSVSNSHTIHPIALVVGALTIAVAIYGFVLDLNALAAGSGMTRWRVFFVWLLVATIIISVEFYALPLLALPFGIHFSPTTWP